MMSQLAILGYVALAMLLGGVVGFDRELSQKPAGLRTHMFVAGTAAFIVSLSTVLVAESPIPNSLVQADPIRILEALITGVSFLGAGTILRQENKAEIKWLTTAASLLFTAVLGAAVALELFLLSAGATILAVLLLRSGKLMDQYLAKHTDNEDDEQEEAEQQSS